jgi:hypothetical protein
MVTADVLDLRTTTERVIQVHRPAADDHEDVSDSVVSERPSDVVGKADGAHGFVAIQ